MKNLHFIATEGEPKPEDFQALSKGLLSHHTTQGRPKEYKKFCIFLKDKNDKTQAGIIITFLYNGMHINSLWVDDGIRNQDWGSKLLSMAEDEARKRGCTIAYTDTYTWQAPGFYEKLGYTLYGKLDDFPKGSSLNYYCKKLNK